MNPTRQELWQQTVEEGLSGVDQRLRFHALMVEHGYRQDESKVERPHVTLTAAARELGVDPGFLNGLVGSGHLEGFTTVSRKGHRSQAVYRDSLDALKQKLAEAKQ